METPEPTKFNRATCSIVIREGGLIKTKQLYLTDTSDILGTGGEMIVSIKL